MSRIRFRLIRGLKDDLLIPSSSGATQLLLLRHPRIKESCSRRFRYYCCPPSVANYSNSSVKRVTPLLDSHPLLTHPRENSTRTTYYASLNASSFARSLYTTSGLATPRALKANIPATPEEAQRIIDENARKAEEETDADGVGPMKSHPYRAICSWKSKSELAKVLLDNTIYNENGLFVTNKPFGVGVYKPPVTNKPYSNTQLHLRGVTVSEYSLEDVLPNLQNLLDMPNLVLAKSTERLTSGLAVFAKDEETRTRFSSALKGSKSYYDTQYKYHVINTLPPVIYDPYKVERVGITIKKGAETDVGQPVIMQDYSKNSVKRQEIISAHVRISMLKAGFNGGFLTEINTSSVAHNFLRIYCADKLAPILGDHLYSCRVQTLRGIPTKIDPTHLLPGNSNQKIPVDMLEALQMKTPDDTLIIPLHAHLRSYKLRKFLGGAEIEFEAPYPPHFKWTCQQLGITLDENRP